MLRAYPKTSSFGPMLRSRSFSILEIVMLFLRLKKSCGLAWNQNLRFSDRLSLRNLNHKSAYVKKTAPKLLHGLPRQPLNKPTTQA
jgi:hypothetical protein